MRVGWKQWLSANVIVVLPRLGIGLGLGIVALVVFTARVDHVIHDGLAVDHHENLHVHRP
jgi:thioester reductase-like protein